MSESFWVLPDNEQQQTPYGILREQAQALTARTNGVFEGVVESLKDGSRNRRVALSIRVPALDGYTYRLLTYIQPAEMYPGRLESVASDEATEVKDEASFIEILRSVLAAERTKRVVGSLLAQANDMAM